MKPGPDPEKKLGNARAPADTGGDDGSAHSAPDALGPERRRSTSALNVGYSSDDASGSDRLNIGPDVETLASVIMAKPELGFAAHGLQVPRVRGHVYGIVHTST